MINYFKNLLRSKILLPKEYSKPINFWINSKKKDNKYKIKNILQFSQNLTKFLKKIDNYLKIVKILIKYRMMNH